jgi:ERCC4-related helicase
MSSISKNGAFNVLLNHLNKQQQGNFKTMDPKKQMKMAALKSVLMKHLGQNGGRIIIFTQLRSTVFDILVQLNDCPGRPC